MHHCQRDFRDSEYLRKLCKESLNTLLCKFYTFSRQNVHERVTYHTPFNHWPLQSYPFIQKRSTFFAQPVLLKMCNCNDLTHASADPRMDTPLEWKDNVSHPVLEMISCSCFQSLMTCWMSQAICCSFIFSVDGSPFYSAMQSAVLAMIDSVRPSDRLTVRPSVTVRYHAKTTPATIMRSSLEDSPMILVSSTLDFTARFQWEHGERGRRMREG